MANTWPAAPEAEVSQNADSDASQSVVNCDGHHSSVREGRGREQEVRPQGKPRQS